MDCTVLSLNREGTSAMVIVCQLYHLIVLQAIICVHTYHFPVDMERNPKLLKHLHQFRSLRFGSWNKVCDQNVLSLPLMTQQNLITKSDCLM